LSVCRELFYDCQERQSQRKAGWWEEPHDVQKEEGMLGAAEKACVVGF
jgi:hypothetical protein